MPSIPHSVLDNLDQLVQLSIRQLLEDWDFPEVHLHLGQLSLFLLIQEVIVVLALKVEEVSVLDSPHGRVTSALADVAQMIILLQVFAQAELAEIIALIKLGENDLLWLE